MRLIFGILIIIVLITRISGVKVSPPAPIKATITVIPIDSFKMARKYIHGKFKIPHSKR